MAKRGRKPKGCSFDELEAGLRSQIDEAIRSHADESAASIYRRFGLAQRGIILNTFQKHVGEVRRLAAGERLSIVDGFKEANERMAVGDMIVELRRRVLVAALNSLDAGDAKPYETVSMLARVQEFDRVEIMRAADKRAEEMHRIKIEQLSKDLRKSVDEKTDGGTKTLTREDVADLIDQIMRGQG